MKTVQASIILNIKYFLCDEHCEVRFFTHSLKIRFIKGAVVIATMFSQSLVENMFEDVTNQNLCRSF